MESAKLKNIVLVILLLTNALLLGLMVFQRLENHQHRRQALADAVVLLEQKGITADLDALPDEDFPDPMALERDADRERELFTALLGDDTTLSQRGLVSYYTGNYGTAEVRGDGAFSVYFPSNAYRLYTDESMEVHALAVLERMGFHGQLVNVDAEAGVVTAVECWKDSPIFSCAVTLTYEDGCLRTIGGTRLVGVPTADSRQGAPLSTATLLLRFRSGIMDSGSACTAILEATQGYTLRANAAGQLRLVPVLRLETDTNPYLLDALTGSLSRA